MAQLLPEVRYRPSIQKLSAGSHRQKHCNEQASLKAYENQNLEFSYPQALLPDLKRPGAYLNKEPNQD